MLQEIVRQLRPKIGKKNWTLKVALRPSGVLLVDATVLWEEVWDGYDGGRFGVQTSAGKDSAHTVMQKRARILPRQSDHHRGCDLLVHDAQGQDLTKQQKVGRKTFFRQSAQGDIEQCQGNG